MTSPTETPATAAEGTALDVAAALAPERPRSRVDMGIEALAVVFGLASVMYIVKGNILSWPTGLVMVCLYTWIFWQARLYSDMVLQVIYIPLQVWGWWVWTHNPPGDFAPNALAGGQFALWLALGAVGTVALGWGMARWTRAAVPYGDAATTVLSLVAQYLMTAGLVECWYFWIAVDVLAIGIYLYKRLFGTAVLYMAFLILACMGLREWLSLLP